VRNSGLALAKLKF